MIDRWSPSLAAIAALAAALPAEAGEQDPAQPALMPNVVVIGSAMPDPGSEVLIEGGERRAPAADGADLLREVNGVSAGRMGGRGLEPVIRGQSQGRLNVLMDGAYVFGACPNRMDPPSAFAATRAWDRITVLKGVQTLQWGGGGSGGTVIYERDGWPDTPGVTASAGAASSSNGTDYELFGDLAHSADSYYFRGQAQTSEAGNYEDGSGDKVRSAYTDSAASLQTGATLNGRDRFEVSVDLTRGEDIHYAGAGMDAPKDDSDAYRFSYRAPISQAELNVEGWYNTVHHLMDNFSVRQLAAPMAMRVPARSRTYGGRAQIELPTGTAWQLTVGLDHLGNSRHATRYQGGDPQQVDVVNSFLWPGADLRQTGLIIEGERSAANGVLRFGMRYDHVEAGVGKADADPGPAVLRSPNELYRAYYGRGAADENEDNVSLLARFERPLWPHGPRLFAGVSRTLRTADATERYIAANSPANAAMRWVGNPGLAPEDHRQLDVGFAWQDRAWQVTGALFYDDVKDYITPDRARFQSGIYRGDGARIYRNVGAEIYGAELEARWEWATGWLVELSAAYTHADNTEDDRPLPQTPPLNGLVQVVRSSDRWEGGARLRWADSQSRADDDPATGSGLDARETPGHGVLDLFGRLDTQRFGIFNLGIDNLLDKTWADHLNRGNQDPFNPDPVQVNEPGRTLWANWQHGF